MYTSALKTRHCSMRTVTRLVAMGTELPRLRWWGISISARRTHKLAGRYPGFYSRDFVSRFIFVTRIPIPFPRCFLRPRMSSTASQTDFLVYLYPSRTIGRSPATHSLEPSFLLVDFKYCYNTPNVIFLPGKPASTKTKCLATFMLTWVADLRARPGFTDLAACDLVHCSRFMHNWATFTRR